MTTYPESLAQLVDVVGHRTELVRSTGCVLLTRTTRGGRYARGARARLGGQRVYRLALELQLGRQLASDEYACHTCDEPMCINWWHLWVGSHEDNIADMRRKGRNAPGWEPGVLQVTSANQAGWTHSDETKQKMRERRLGRKDSDEVRANKRAAAQARVARQKAAGELYTGCIIK